MVMISQFFVLSHKGNNIVFRDYCGDVQKGSAEIFFHKVKFWNENGEAEEEEEAPPAIVECRWCKLLPCEGGWTAICCRHENQHLAFLLCWSFCRGLLASLKIISAF